MRYKRNLKSMLKATVFSLKSIGLKGMIPFVGFDVFFPLLLIQASIKGQNFEMLELQLLQITQILFPFFCVWNVVFISKEYIESQGNEVLYLNKQVRDIDLYALVFSIALINVIIVMLICSAFVYSFAIEIFRIVSASIFLYGITIVALYSTKSTAIALLVQLIYLILNYLLKGDKLLPCFYMSNEMLTLKTSFSVCIPLLFVGFLFIFLGKIFRKRMLFK